MAVYTHLCAEQITVFIRGYDVGRLLAHQPIAEGVENSNYLLTTTSGRFILTLYEKRVSAKDLPFFIALLDHLAIAGLPVPVMIADRKGEKIHQLADRPACLIQFLSGRSLGTGGTGNAAQCRSTGIALATMHRALADFPQGRANGYGLQSWRGLAESCIGLNSISLGLERLVWEEIAFLEQHWTRDFLKDLPAHVIHADLFPDNVLMTGNRVTGLIDFYFAAHDLRCFDLAIMHAGWVFSEDGRIFYPDHAAALLGGYSSIQPLNGQEVAALPIVARGAALRFLLTRSYDWLNHPADALVERKDPMAFLHRLEYYRRTDANCMFEFAL